MICHVNKTTTTTKNKLQQGGNVSAISSSAEVCRETGTEHGRDMHSSGIRDVLGEQGWDRMKCMRVDVVECVTLWTHPVLQTTLIIIEPKRHAHAQQQE